MKIKKILATIGVTALLTGAGLMAAQSASAHDAFLKGTAACNTADGSATVTWTLSNDWDTPATVSNTTNSSIPDGTVIPKKVGNTNGTKTFVQTIAAPAAGVSASAAYTATWPDHTVRNIAKVTVTVPTNCTVPPAKDASAAATVTPADCAVPAVLHLTGTNVTWSGTEDGATGPKSYSSTATATSGHTFPNGDASQKFTGDLAGPLGYQNTNPEAPCYKAHDDATATVSVTQPTCSVPGTASYLVQNAELVGQLDQTAGTHTATFNAKPGHEFSDGVTTVEKSYTVAAATGDCPQPPIKPAASVTKPKLADTGSDVTVGLAVGLIALLGGATGVGITMFRRRRGNAQA